MKILNNATVSLVGLCFSNKVMLERIKTWNRAAWICQITLDDFRLYCKDIRLDVFESVSDLQLLNHKSRLVENKEKLVEESGPQTRTWYFYIGETDQ